MRTILVLFISTAVFGQGTTSITGKVSDEQNRPVAATAVLYNSVRPFLKDALGRLTPAGPLVSGTVRTQNDGTFTITGVPAGNYYLCATGTKPNDLDSCSWSAPISPVSSGGRADLVVRSGIVITMRLADPQHRLAGADFSAALISDAGQLAVAELQEQVKDSAVFRVVAPRGARLQLFLDTDLSVAHSTGLRLPSRVPSIPVPTQSDFEIQLSIE